MKKNATINPKSPLEHAFPLRADTHAIFSLPRDITYIEVKRLSKFLESLVIEEYESP